MNIGTNDVHLIGKILDGLDNLDLAEMGFSTREIVRADALFEDLSGYLNRMVGMEWEDREVA